MCLKVIRRNKQRKLRRKLTPEKIELLKIEGNLWHRRMGHISANYLSHMRIATEGVGDLIPTASILNCNECAFAKLKRKSFLKDRERATRVGEVVHTDVVGPIKPPTYFSKKRYIHSVIDDYSRYLQVFLLKSRSDIPECVNEAYHYLRAKYPTPGQFNLLRCDNAPKFLSKETSKSLINTMLK